MLSLHARQIRLHVWLDQWFLPAKKLSAAIELVQEQLGAGHIESSTSI